MATKISGRPEPTERWGGGGGGDPNEYDISTAHKN